jgi:hypothetical protein
LIGKVYCTICSCSQQSAAAAKEEEKHADASQLAGPEEEAAI